MVVVSDNFKNLSKIEKQRLVYSSLGELMSQIHALTLTCQTIEEAKIK
jgi:stress-induced morphogen